MKKVFSIALILAIAVMSLVGCAKLTSEQAMPAETESVFSDLFIHKSSGATVFLQVEIADEPAEREKGLMGRTSLEENYGMLFIFQEEAPRQFWMRNTKISLDMIFTDKEMNIIGIVEGAKPCKKDPCPRYGLAEPAQHVLEVNAGFVEKYNIQVGDYISEML